MSFSSFDDREIYYSAFLNSLYMLQEMGIFLLSSFLLEERGWIKGDFGERKGEEIEDTVHGGAQWSLFVNFVVSTFACNRHEEASQPLFLMML